MLDVTEMTRTEIETEIAKFEERLAELDRKLAKMQRPKQSAKDRFLKAIVDRLTAAVRKERGY
jgi:succinate dehydrogenase flavin-adding protein (antitoxin of CptAB toxin-antitoxin module)